MEYEIIVGLEVHVELSTKSKIYCSCTTDFGGEPNTHICPVCTGMPGVLPVLNKKVVEYAVKTGLATNCSIAKYSKQDRKNYFYPDLPKAYQISQYDLPLCRDGYIDIEVEGRTKRIGITRIHIEEDAGKLVHDQNETGTLIDYNRCGVPLIEIVTEPDMRSAQEARAFVESLRNILRYIDVSDCKMQEGSLRVDVNLSVRPKGQKEFGTRTEMKNLNSIRSMVGHRIDDGETLKGILKAIEALADPEVFKSKYKVGDDKGVLLFAVGDGNHSLASAKVHWENVKKSLSEAEVEDHPARFALVEVVNVHDDGIVFEPIHRVLFNIEPESVLNALQDFFGSSCCSLEKFDSLESVNKRLSELKREEAVHSFGFVTDRSFGVFTVQNPNTTLRLQHSRVFSITISESRRKRKWTTYTVKTW